MYYLKLPYMDNPVCVFDICQAHLQLESDYNLGGILMERPSNRRRNASTGVQLHRMKYRGAFRWVEICAEADPNDDDDEDVRDIYLINVMKWGLPVDDEMYEFITKRYTEDFVNQFNFARRF